MINMRIKDLINELQKLPKDQQDATIDVFDAKSGIYQPINKLQPYDPKAEKLSMINPLLIVINRKLDQHDK